MKSCEMCAKIEWLANYVFCGFESEELRAKYEEMCKLRMQYVSLKKELEEIINERFG